MFDALANRLQDALGDLGRRSRLDEETVTRALALDPTQLESLVTTELALAQQRQGESIGNRLVASARKR